MPINTRDGDVYDGKLKVRTVYGNNLHYKDSGRTVLKGICVGGLDEASGRLYEIEIDPMDIIALLSVSLVGGTEYDAWRHSPPTTDDVFVPAS